MTTEQIAELTHEANRVYCRLIDDESQVSWEDAPEWQKKSAIDGVKFIQERPYAQPSLSHSKWVEGKRKDGWVYGEIKDADKKTHPCMVSFYDLPSSQKNKDFLFVGIVRTMT